MVKVAATQMKSSNNIENNIHTAESLVKKAAAAGANIILIQELFETDYFCKKPIEKNILIASSTEENKAIQFFKKLARELSVVLPVSFFEKCNNAYYNSLAIIDADGSILGIYRKSHIPDGPGYHEKFYFNPGDTGFKIWDTAYAKIGCGVCWDQWFPEAARIMALKGAELLLYPTAIGSEPLNPLLDSKLHWRTCMQGHAAANITPIIASNRIGTEIEGDYSINFYGSSFIADECGQIIAQADEFTETYITAEFDLDAIALKRRSWGIFRDRRPSLYKSILTQDGNDICI